jgi:hypothetical protein
MKIAFPVLVGSLLLFGCVGPKPPAEEGSADVMVPQAESQRPENLLFPDYLLMADFEIDQHGRIPENTLVGAEMMTELDLAITLQRFTKVLDAHGWELTRQEIAAQSFRLIAVLNEDRLEIRAVQGTGGTKVFLLYLPGEDSRS